MNATRSAASSLPNPGPPSTAARRHDIDALRVLAFALLILYHCGMFYVADWGWHVKSQYTADWLKFPMVLVNQWRLELLFLISGTVVHFLLDKVSGPRFAWLRTKRLLVPLLFGMAVIVPPQAWLQAQANGAWSGGYLDFLAAYFTLRPWPDGAFDGSEIGVTWNHLWFLPYLLTYTLLLALLLPALRSGFVQRAIARLRGVRGAWLFVLPVVPFVAIKAVWGDAPQTNAFFNDPQGHATYCTAFFIGYLLGRSDGPWGELVRLRWAALPLAAASYLALLAIWFLGLERIGWVDIASGFVQSFNLWFWLVAVLGWGAYALNRPFRGLAYATEAVVSWYILHQTLTVLIGAGLTPYALGPVVEPLLVVGGTVLGCLVLHEYVVRRVRWLRPLFGLKPIGAPGIAREVAVPGPAARGTCE
ncbi:acyltransferase family protein [Halomonas denitrificans]|nr:acyltransferase family protein [Halomonas denitrificans]